MAQGFSYFTRFLREDNNFQDPILNNLSPNNPQYPYSSIFTALFVALGLNVRTKAATDYYVDPAGNDANNGLSPGTAWATLNHAYAILASLDFANQAVTLHSADGTYTAGLTINQPWTGGGSLTITGNAVTPSNVFINAAVGSAILTTVPLPGLLTLQNFKFAAPLNGVDLEASGVVQVSNLVCGACGNGQFVIAAGGAKMLVTGPYSIIAGTSSIHYLATRTGIIDMNGQQVTLSGTPAYSTFAVARNFGQILRDGAPAPSGAATGNSASATAGGFINTNGAGPAFFPGNGSGTQNTGGQIV